MCPNSPTLGKKISVVRLLRSRLTYVAYRGKRRLEDSARRRRRLGVKNGWCRYHHKSESLCKAHILPRAFYRRISGIDGEGFWLVTKGRQHAKRIPNGLYDQTMICAEADREFGKYDNYAIQLFSEFSPSTVYHDRDGRQFCQLDEYNFDLLSMFILSYLWRCHHSNLDPYRGFGIGRKFEEKIRTLLNTKKFDESYWFDYIVTIFYSSPDELLFPLKFPFNAKKFGLNIIICYFFNYKVLIKLDSRPTPDWFRWASARRGSPLKILASSYDGSVEHQSDLKAFRDALRQGLT